MRLVQVPNRTGQLAQRPFVSRRLWGTAGGGKALHSLERSLTAVDNGTLASFKGGSGWSVDSD